MRVLSSIFKSFTRPLFHRFLRRIVWDEFVAAVQEVQINHHRIFGPAERLSLASTAQVNDALFNLNSGTVSVGEYAFFGHGVSVITGRHDPCKTGVDRWEYPKEGCDVIIEDGVWVGSNATILGPCRIGQNAVVGAMSLVRSDVAANSIVMGIPARCQK